MYILNMSSVLNCRVTFYAGIALSRVHLSICSFCHNFVVVTNTKGTISVNDLVTLTLTLKLKIAFLDVRLGYVIVLRRDSEYGYITAPL